MKKTEKMRKARKEALARLRNLSHDELAKRAEENKDSTTVEFLTELNIYKDRD